MRPTPLAAALLLLLPGIALAQAMPGMSEQKISGSTPPPVPANGVDRDMMAGMDTMQHDMAAAPMTGNADRDFAAMMIPHHRGAVSMAEAELRDGHDPRMRELARQVIAAQDREIALMQHWLATHPAPATAMR